MPATKVYHAITPKTEAILNLEHQDGLLFNKFYKRSALASTDGHLYFGAEQGLVMLDPQDFNHSEKPLTVFINDFKLFNQSVDWRDESENNPLFKPIAFTKEIELNHHNYMFSFSFGASEYVRPDKVVFAYMMEGLDEQWVYTNAENRVASYTTLNLTPIPLESKRAIVTVFGVSKKRRLRSPCCHHGG